MTGKLKLVHIHRRVVLGTTGSAERAPGTFSIDEDGNKLRIEYDRCE